MRQRKRRDAPLEPAVDAHAVLVLGDERRRDADPLRGLAHDDDPTKPGLRGSERAAKAGAGKIWSNERMDACNKDAGPRHQLRKRASTRPACRSRSAERLPARRRRAPKGAAAGRDVGRRGLPSHRHCCGFFRQIVEFGHASIRASRIPALGIGVARGVKGHRVAQTGQGPVVQVRRRQLDVAQGRNLEGAADALDVKPLGREIRQPLAPAQTQIEVIGLCVGGDRHVSRRAERVVSEIGEQPVLGIARARLADMTGEAIALPWILEQREALGFQRRKPPLSAQNRVEGRGEGMEDFLFPHRPRWPA